MRVLITSGGTEEPIDGVRTISNFSSGRTGVAIANLFNQYGANIYFLYGKRSLSPNNKKIATFSYTSFYDLDCKLTKLLNEVKFDTVIHMAAISDYSPQYIEVADNKLKPGISKIESSNYETIKIILKRNPKLISIIKNNKLNKDTTLVAFKLTNTENYESRLSAVSKILKNQDIDILVHNDLTEISDNRHNADIYKNGLKIVSVSSKKELADQLYNTIYGVKR